MIKVLTREYLATYTYLESEIKRLKRRLKYYESNPVQRSFGVVKGSMQQFPFTECHFVVSGPTVKSDSEREKTIRQLVIDLKGNEQLFEDMKLDIECFLEKLPPEELENKQLLTMKYVNRMTDYDIAAEFGCDRRTVNRKIDRFLFKLQSNEK